MMHLPPDALFRDDTFQEERGKSVEAGIPAAPAGGSRQYVGTSTTTTRHRSKQCQAYSSLGSVSFPSDQDESPAAPPSIHCCVCSNSTLAEQHFETTLRAAPPHITEKGRQAQRLEGTSTPSGRRRKNVSTQTAQKYCAGKQ